MKGLMMVLIMFISLYEISVYIKKEK